MAVQALVRIVTFLMVVAASAATKTIINFGIFTTILAVAHYALAAVYSRRQFANAWSRPLPALLLTGLLLGGLALYQFSLVPIVLIFLPHLVFNEVYLTEHHSFGGAQRNLGGFSAAAITVNSLIYLQIINFHDWFGVHCGSKVLMPLIAVSAAWFAFELWRKRNLLGAQGILDASTYTLLGVAGLIISRFYQLTIWHMVAYHVIFWAFYPLVKMWDMRDGKRALGYLAANVVAVAGVTLLTPVGCLPWHLSQPAVDKMMIFTSIMHIMVSFGTSRAQPAWIWRIFQPLPPSPIAAPQAMAPAPERILVGSSK